MITTVLELWRGGWWRWWMRDGAPFAFLPDGATPEAMPTPRG